MSRVFSKHRFLLYKLDKFEVIWSNYEIVIIWIPYNLNCAAMFSPNSLHKLPVSLHLCLHISSNIKAFALFRYYIQNKAKSDYRTLNYESDFGRSKELSGQKTSSAFPTHRTGDAVSGSLAHQLPAYSLYQSQDGVNNTVNHHGQTNAWILVEISLLYSFLLKQFKKELSSQFYVSQFDSVTLIFYFGRVNFSDSSCLSAFVKNFMLLCRM